MTEGCFLHLPVLGSNLPLAGTISLDKVAVLPEFELVRLRVVIGSEMSLKDSPRALEDLLGTLLDRFFGTLLGRCRDEESERTDDDTMSTPFATRLFPTLCSLFPFATRTDLSPSKDGRRSMTDLSPSKEGRRCLFTRSTTCSTALTRSCLGCMLKSASSESSHVVTRTGRRKSLHERDLSGASVRCFASLR